MPKLPSFLNRPRPAASNAAAQVPQLLSQALALHQQGQFNGAATLYEEVLAVQPRNFNALQLLGTIAAQTGHYQRAVALLDKALQIDPSHAPTHNNLGNVLKELKQFDAALASYDKAIANKADYADAYNNRGNVLQDLKQYGAALQSYDRAIALKPDYAEAYSNRGFALQELKQLDAALESYDKAIAIKPDFAEAYNDRGTVLKELNQLDAALQSYDRAIAVRADHAKAYNNRGTVLQELRQLDAALASYDKAIAISPDYATAYNNRGTVLKELNQLDAALQSYDRALALEPDYAEAYGNRGFALQELRQLDAALQSYDRALALKPDYAFLYGMRLHTKMRLCDWRDLGAEFAQLAARIERSANASPPFPVLAITSSPLLQRKAAEIWMREECCPSHALPQIPKHPRRDRIRIGYYSADYHNHATAYLMAELFEKHDRTKFELIAFSFGPENGDEMRHRLVVAFDKFIDVRARSDRDIALLSRKLGIDIAIDLKGLTQDSRAGIFAERAAPLQVNYLGYPGTMGAEYIDYLIADQTLIPKGSQQHYSEKIVYLPDCYQVNDTKRRISDKAFAKEDLGLPRAGFVFCCFNNNYKITPGTFDGWMRILQRVDGSVLWLLEDNAISADNLRKEATRRGVSAGRLAFAKRLPLPEHLARHRAADLFLDTLPCNAHTTASDALWAGLPVLTCTGAAFASRVAASLLAAVGLPELITHTQEEYETLAVELATNTRQLAQVKQRLEQNRLTTPLFDTPLVTKHIEAAYTAMYERYHANLAPDHIYVKR